MIAALLTYLPLLLATLAIELLVVAMLARTQRRAALRACLALNLCTHPLATLLVWYVLPETLAIEAFVLVAEWIGYSWLLQRAPLPALLLALPANALSMIAGVFLSLLPM